MEKTVKGLQGRPIGSKVRQNMVEILYFYKNLHGYDLHKIYVDLYPPVTMRLIYYHLKKGLATGEFKISSVQKKQGDYSWGAQSENVIYELGPTANPMIEPRIKLYLEESESKNIQKKA